MPLTRAAVTVGAPLIVRFDRNAVGEVTGFSYSDPLLPGLRFDRPSEGANGGGLS